MREFIGNYSASYFSDHLFWSSAGQGAIEKGKLKTGMFVLHIGRVSMDIEEFNAYLRQGAIEVDAALYQIADGANKVRAIRDVLVPDLQEMIRQIRAHRMATEQEMRQTLAWLQEVRDFFLENNYDKEMERLRDFITICKQIQILKDDGILDAVADLALKLAIGGEERRREET